VNFKIAKDFTNRVKKALGQDVLTTLQPGQLLVKLVKDLLTELMGGDVAGIFRKSYSYLDVRFTRFR
jgi:signal recognition particle subunit SRP54